MRTLLGIVAVLTLTADISSAQESIAYDSVQGLYHVYYLDLTDAGEDTLVYGAVFSGKAAAPQISASVSSGVQEGSLKFSYSLTNGPDGAPGLVTHRGIRYFFIDSEATVDSVLADDSWYARYATDHQQIRWSGRGLDNAGIAIDSTVSGFYCISNAPPTITSSYVAPRRGLRLTWGTGPPGDMAETIDSLERATWTDTLLTIGPRDPPTPFNLNDFLDTLATYPLRAATEDWIADSTAADLDALLNDASSALTAGDSTWAATLLGAVLNHVETVKDDSLSSEGYALMKFNIEHALGYLPALVPVRVFLQGPFNSGVMTTKNGGTPTVQPFGDEALPFNYGGNESLTSFPGFVADWIHVMLIDTTEVWRVEHARPALLSKFGFAHPSFPASVSGDYILAVGEYNHAAVASDTLVTISNGSAGHDFTLGAAYSQGSAPQKSLSGGLFGMFAADGTQDGQVTAPDFNLWNVGTTSGATGYHAADYNRDQIVTVPDFNLWNQNTTSGARNPQVLNEAIHGIPPLEAGPMAMSGGSPTCHIRLHVVNDSDIWFWVEIQARADTSLAPNTTFGSATIDVSYDASELTFKSSGAGVLKPQDGYSVSIKNLVDGSDHSVRVSYTSNGIGADPSSYPGHDLDTDWELIRTLYFSRTPPIEDDGTSFVGRSLSIGFYDSPSDSNGTNNIVEAVVEVQ